MMCYVFFFKQKTAYEVRISDWSSDVCSSDLAAWGQSVRSTGCGGPHRSSGGRTAPLLGHDRYRGGFRLVGALRADRLSARLGSGTRRLSDLFRAGGGASHLSGRLADRRRRPRSEEHTSELQSLMRISYAVFCMKKKKTRTQQLQHTITTTTT